MKFIKTIGVAALALSMLAVSPVQAKPLKIGLVLSMSGPFADYGKQIMRGIEVYMKMHGDTVAGRDVKLIVKDDTGIAPARAKRLAKQLVINNKVDILAGFDLSPNAFSAAPVATKAKVPMVVMNAATASVTSKSPYIVRTSMTMEQGAFAAAKWAYNSGIRTVYILVADYAPGHNVQAKFKETFTKLGGEIVGEVRTPVQTADYTPYLLRVQDAAPDALFFFVPPGSSMVSLVKNFRDMGLGDAGITPFGPGDMTDASLLPVLGDAVLGMITAFHYSTAHESSENKAFIAAYHEAWPDGGRPNFMTVGGYDGMQLIYKVLKKTNGDASAEAFIAAAEGMEWMSPRGPVKIGVESHDIIQNEYLRKVKRVDGMLQNVEFQTFEAVPPTPTLQAYGE